MQTDAVGSLTLIRGNAVRDKRITISLDEESYNALRAISDFDQRSLSWLACQAVRDFISQRVATHPSLTGGIQSAINFPQKRSSNDS